MAGEGVKICSENGSPLWLGGACLHRAWALARLGRTEVGLGEIRGGMIA